MVTSNLSLSRMVAQCEHLSCGQDRRAHARIAFDCPVRWGGVDGDRHGWARDASRGGASFSVPMASAPAVGDTINLAFCLDNYCEWRMGEKARVCWARPGDGDLCDVGVEFDTLTASPAKA